ncbi:hypothetical protein GA0074695_1861 [Micromonospora viridifaciens]|uniref:Uncharacterized protein n=1 Tax=Micromonospora viridifaciens TaxID=1881 RepID=A0A1C4VX26_MICVI|nr:hypothetical protein [Micromonospora viridifaciens]SCE88279.1 hypothetical protein GA0074695_1861 [Micromonospora viridifaciens]
MVTRRLAGFLLRSAVRRWPAELRDELSREWQAELHVLAERGERWRMLTFAASLAASRPGAPVVDRARFDARARRAAATLLLAPVACVAIVVLAAVVSNALIGQVGLAAGLALPHAPVLSALAAVLAVWFARRVGRGATRTALRGRLRPALGVVLPIALTAVAIEYALNETTDDLVRFAPGLVVWLTGLALVLWGVGTLAGRGRVRAAWCLGVLGALVAADAAVVLTVVNHVPGGPPTVIDGVAQGDTVDRISAPLWLFTCWTDWSFGLPRPTREELFLIGDLLDLQPFLHLTCTPYALAYAIGAARSAGPAGVPAAEPVASPA